MKFMRNVLIWGCLAMLAGWMSLPGGSQAEEAVRTRTTGMGALSGRVTLGPVSPVQRPGGPPAMIPAPEVKLLIYGPARQEVAAVVTDADGKFRVDLPPGNYQVEMAPRKGKEFTKDLPKMVTITPGQKMVLNIRLDTGMR